MRYYLIHLLPLLKLTNVPILLIVRFNVAEIGAMTQDLPFQAKNLVKRMLSDPKVDIRNHWKLITILIGDNDFCSNMCFLKNPEQILTNHEYNLINTLRILRDYLPRTMVNLAATPSNMNHCVGERVGLWIQPIGPIDKKSLVDLFFQINASYFVFK